MQLIDILNAILQAADYEECNYCIGATMTAVAAAFQTQGMFVQADLLWYLNYSSMAAFGPLIYTCAFMAGLVNVALGMPPRNYLWCFLGPTFFLWLTDNPVEANGTFWQVGATADPADADNPHNRPMKDVWRIAEVGLRNSAIVDRAATGGLVDSNGNPLKLEISGDKQPSDGSNPSFVEVALPFMWWDELVSWNVQWLVTWTGIDVMLDKDTAAGYTNINPQKDSTGAALPLKFDEARWDVLRNNTWKIVEDMTDVKFTNPDSRDAFVNFMASECGRALSQVINAQAYSQAARSRGKYIPISVIRGYESGDYTAKTIKNKVTQLRNTKIPVHRSLRSLLQPPLPSETMKNGTFREFLASTKKMDDAAYGPLGTSIVGDAFDVTDSERIIPKESPNRTGMSCSDYLFLVVNLFRWEAGLAYYNMIKAAEIEGSTDAKAGTFEQPLKEEHVVYNLYYGWGIRKGDPFDPADETTADLMDIGELKEFTKQLMAIYMFRNEMQIAPQISNVTYTPSQNLANYAQAQQRSTGASTKYGEIYTWAMMVPYMQGVTLYFLAAAYPLACLAVIFPGMHKVIFTWMSFWLWVKLWDVGFAMVMVMERSIWAMLGQSKNNHQAFDWVWSMVDFPAAGVGAIKITPPPAGSENFTPKVTSDANYDYIEALYFIDTALMLGGALDIDVSNAYYVYLTSALYFAVPAVTGQCVLGAKSGAAGLVTGSFQQQASDAGRGASAGYTGNAAAQIGQASSTASQSTYESGLRQGGLAGAAISAGAKSVDSQNAASAAGMWQTGYGAQQTAISQGEQAANRATKNTTVPAAETASAIAGASGGPGGIRGGLTRFAVKGAAGYVRIAEQFAMSHTGNVAGGRTMEADKSKNLMGLAGSAASAQGNMHGQAQNRLQEASNYDAQNRQADQMRNTQLGTAGMMAAMGQMAGGQYGYNRPTGMPNAVGMMGGLVDGKGGANDQAQRNSMGVFAPGTLNGTGLGQDLAADQSRGGGLAGGRLADGTRDGGGFGHQFGVPGDTARAVGNHTYGPGAGDGLNREGGLGAGDLGGIRGSGPSAADFQRGLETGHNTGGTVGGHVSGMTTGDGRGIRGVGDLGPGSVFGDRAKDSSAESSTGLTG